MEENFASSPVTIGRIYRGWGRVKKLEKRQNEKQKKTKKK